MNATHNVNGIAPLSAVAYDLLASLSAGVEEARQPVARRATFYCRYGTDIIAMIRAEADACDSAIREAVAHQIEMCGSTLIPANWSVSRAVSAVRDACRIEREIDPA